MQLCPVLAQQCHRTRLVLRFKLEPHHLNHPNNFESFHTSAVNLLRKAPQSRNTIFGIPLSFIPWPTQMLRYAIRKRTHPHQFGKTDDIRRNIFHRLSVVYALLTWTALGLVGYYYMYMYKPENHEDSEDTPYQEEIDKGGALYWITALKGRNDIKDDHDIYVYKVKGFGFEKENVTNKARVITEHYRREVEAKSDNALLRNRLGLPLEREEGGVSDEELPAVVQALGKDYEMEMDYLEQQRRRAQFEGRTDEELKALDTFEGKVKLYLRGLGRRIRKTVLNEKDPEKLETEFTEEEVAVEIK